MSGYDEDCMSPEAADLIKNLLILDHTKRLGANGAVEIKNHIFFQSNNRINFGFVVDFLQVLTGKR
jgi:hypothetical protein